MSFILYRGEGVWYRGELWCKEGVWYRGGVCLGGYLLRGCLPGGGVSAQGGVCPGMVSAQRVLAQGVSAQWGFFLGRDGHCRGRYASYCILANVLVIAW